MNENKTFRQELKDWWQNNKRVIKAGITFGALGVAYGFIKGAAVTDKMWMEHGFGMVEDYAGDPDDEDAGLTEENCDDPELLEIVNSEHEN